MPTYEVEIETLHREVYQLEAENAEDAQENWDLGTIVLSENISVQEVFPAREVID